jgi:pyrimidine operon attenuation protein / uracil phosphoribosyltransferase
MVQAHTVKAVILDRAGLGRAWRRIAHEVIERQPQLDRLVLVGIVRRGVPLAERLALQLEQLEGMRVPIVPLDVRAYRDDLPRTTVRPPEVEPELIRDRPVLLVDDVLYHGRTIRAALDAVMAVARPSAIQLAVLVDRGHRELPIRPDYVGKNVPTSEHEWIEVHLDEIDGQDSVRILERRAG